MAVFTNKKELITALVLPGDTVLDIGFWGQGVGVDSPEWVHALLRARAREVWGIDTSYDETKLPGGPAHYLRASAESFSLNKRFDVIFAGDLIEHLSNPGLFLAHAKQHLAPGGRLILSTPNAFNLFNIAEKFSKGEPTVNADHTCYFNEKTLRQSLRKNGWRVERIDFVYSLGVLHRESWKKKILNGMYWLLSLFTPRFIETLAVVAVPDAV
ncbi:class I SAM-dependent methyltransferase [Candidatus Kaiserbacteria bacterium]|nr:class I SAM-dependent methyltransferase [Candidatus Kaiserbacteria bacterium]